MKLVHKRSVSLLLTIAMVFSLVPRMTVGVLAAKSTETSRFAGKTVSILSHSASTYAGVSNDAADNSTIGDNDVYYTEGRHGVYQKDTWWQQVIDALDMGLLVNNSWSGSCVFMPRKGEASVGYGDRAENLHNDHTGEEPDVIFVYLGCNDFAYYQDSFGKVADVDYAQLIQDNNDGTVSYSAPQTTCEAYAVMLHKVQTRYPAAEIYCMTSTARRDPDYADNYADTGQPTEYSAELQAVAGYFGFPVIDLENCIPKEAEIFDQYMGDKRAHPNALGMDQITNEVLSVMLGQESEICHVTSKEGVVAERAVLLGGSYCAETDLRDGYSAVVTMSGADVTSEVYKDGKIVIDEVTGDIAVHAVLQRNPANFRWEIQNNQLVSVGNTENPLLEIAETVTDGVLVDGRYELTTPVVLKHDVPWAVEWQCSEDWRGAVFSSDPGQQVTGMCYLTRTKGGQLCFGTWNGTQYDNYGVDLSGLDDQIHTYRLENRMDDSGNNMVWLYVDDVEIGPMNNYFIGSQSQNVTSDWISGKDLTFSYIGMEGHALRNCQLNYLWVEETVHTHSYESNITAPTCTEQGYTTYTCTCGDNYVADYVARNEHSYNDGVCTVCGREEPNPYKGKTVACIGDSITYGIGVTRDRNDYVTVLAKALEMDYIRLGASGTTLCTDGHATCNIGKLTEENLAGADVVTVLMGINDFVQARNGYYTLGTIDSKDTSTIYGAVHMWCQKIEELRRKEILKDTEFYFMTPVITSWNNSVSSARNWDQSKANIHGYTLRDLCNAIIEVCALYDIPVIDLNLISGLYYNSAEDHNIDQFGGDGAHPGETGHRMMADAIRNALLKNNLREDHDHSYGSWITTDYPDCDGGEQQRVCAVCTATERKTLDGQGHAYENGSCIVCGAAQTDLSAYKGKVISVMGDSISTFAGYIPTADGFNLEHLARYPQDNLLTDVNETWWMQVIAELDAKLGINDSWRGATVSGAAPVTSGTSGENAAMANLTRIQNLGANGTPDVILFYGGTNDLAHVSKVGSFDAATAPAEVDLTTKKWDNLADGYVHTLLRLQHYYPDAQIVALLPAVTTSYYSNEKLAQANAVLAEICAHYDVACTDLRECGISTADLPDGIHPDATGMDYITDAVLDVLMTTSNVTAGEHVVHSITHELTNAEASKSYYKGVSHGLPFAETVSGEDLTVTVTMDGEDVTDECYGDGIINIASVAGDIIVQAKAGFSLVKHLREIPENVCGSMNLWTTLEHDKEYYTVNGWGIHASGKVYSVTIPVDPADQIWATSFQTSEANGGTINGIRVTWFGESGVLESVSADRVYTEFAANGYLTVPEEAVAVNIPMWSDSGELYILNRDHVYEDGACIGCGEENSNITASISMRYDDHLDVSGKQVEIIDAGSPTSYQVGYGVEENTVRDTAVVTLEGDALVAMGTGTAKVRIDGALYEITVTAAPISLMLLAGQSNMQGIEGNASESIVCPSGQVYATYADRYKKTVEDVTKFAPSALAGQYSGINVTGDTACLESFPVNMLTDAGNGREGMDSGLAYEWVQQTGEKIWVVNLGYGGSSIKEWLNGGTHYNACAELFAACQETLRKEIAAGHFTLSHMGYFWCQGCADETQTAQWYAEKFRTMHQLFKEELAFDHDSDASTQEQAFEFAGIIPIRSGHSGMGSYRAGIYEDTTSVPYYQSFKDLRFNGPRVAQYWMGNNPELADIWNVCTIQEKWATLPDGSDGVAEYFRSVYQNGKVDYVTQAAQNTAWYTPTTPAAVHDNIHYNQIGYNEIGRESARNALIMLGEAEAPRTETTVQFMAWDGFTPVEEITAAVVGSSGTLVVPMVEPVFKSKEVRYAVSDGLEYTYYDLLADSPQADGMLTAIGAEGSVTVVGRELSSFRWSLDGSDLVNDTSCGDSKNELVKLAGSVTDGQFTGVRYQAGQSMMLLHDRPWTVEIQMGNWTATTGTMMLSGSGNSTNGLPYLYFRPGDYFVGIGYYDGAQYHNYGISLKEHDIACSEGTHTYRFVNHMEDDGTNMIYLMVDGQLIGALTDHYINSTLKDTDNHWLSGQDFTMSYFGTSNAPISGCVVNYLFVDELDCDTQIHIHSWSNWEMVTEPSADGPGEERRICADCGENDTRAVEGVWQTHDLGDYLVDLPETYCAGTNLWMELPHDEYYYHSGTHWAKHESGTVRSVTIPICGGDKLYASSFGAAGSNGNSSNGIRVTFFDAYGVAKMLAPADTYAEFTANGGYLAAPEGAVAVNIPMWNNSDENELYILNAEHTYHSEEMAPTCTEQGYTTYTCHCGDQYTVEGAAATGHNYDSGIVTTRPGCELPGVKTFTCQKDASHTHTESIEAIGHQFSNYLPNDDATCTADGTKTSKCDRCDATDTVKDTGSKKEHTYTDDGDADCNICGYEREVAIPSVPMFRMYDPNSGEHFYTGSVEERDGLVAVGWNYEGVAFNFPVVGDPVHRLYNPVSGDHLYTMNEAEKSKLLSEGWNYEGVAFNSADSDQVPQYRVWNPNAKRGAWHFTSSTVERDHLISLGWRYQGIGWYSEWV